MAAPSTVDVLAPFDPTAYTTLTFAQLYQLVSGLVAYTDKGFVVTTTDVGGNPEVPNATVTTKWQRYIWRRISAATTSVYIWDPASATDATYLKWISINIAGIAVGSIVNAMIADNTITDIKIANLDYSKLLNAPTGLPPSGAAGGDLTGTYPDPSIATGAVTGSKIGNATITHANLAANAVQVPTDILPSAVGLSIIRTNAGATALEYYVSLIAQLANPTGPDALKVVRVNAAGSAFEIVSMPGGAIQIVEGTTAAFNGVTANIPIDDTLPDIGEGEEIITVAITPTSATSILYIDAIIHSSNQTTGTYTTIALFRDAVNTCLSASYGAAADANIATSIPLHYKVVSGSTAARTYKIRAGANAGDIYVNGLTGARVLGGALISSIRVTEVVA